MVAHKAPDTLTQEEKGDNEEEDEQVRHGTLRSVRLCVCVWTQA